MGIPIIFTSRYYTIYLIMTVVMKKSIIILQILKNSEYINFDNVSDEPTAKNDTVMIPAETCQTPKI